MKEVSQLGRVPYSFRATQVNLSEVSVDANLSLGSFNISANYGLFGDANATGTVYAQRTKNLSIGYDYALNGTTWTLNYSDYLAIRNYALNDSLWTLNYSDYLAIRDYALNDSRWTLNYSTYLTKPTYSQVVNGTNVALVTASNTFGAFNQTFNTSLLFLWANANRIGINTTSPQNTLNVIGDANITGLIYGNGSQLTNVNATTLDGYDSSFFMPLNTSVVGSFDFNGGWQNGGFSISGGNISLNSVSFVPGGAPEIQNFSNSPYTLKEFSKTNEVLYDYNFYVPMELNFENLSYLDTNNSQVLISDQNHSVALSDNNFSLSAPYLPNIARIAVFDKNGNQLFSFETGPYTKNSSIILGYGGSTLTSINYSLQYTLFPQIVGELNSSAYKLQLGWGVYNE
ncbi:MAG: hypothetical protein HYS80_00985 [Candidatus Aenigmarchaeota archaeon]|nr:hypothetical protein [Candidatus Aenigmarchaeota archaeon]